MKSKIMYIELKSHSGGHDDNGPAWISKIKFSKSGKSLYFREKLLLKYNAGCGNYIDSETDEIYWISGPKKDGQDRYHWAGEKTKIDDDIKEEYWINIRNQPENKNKKIA